MEQSEVRHRKHFLNEDWICFSSQTFFFLFVPVKFSIFKQEKEQWGEVFCFYFGINTIESRNQLKTTKNVDDV